MYLSTEGGKRSQTRKANFQFLVCFYWVIEKQVSEDEKLGDIGDMHLVFLYILTRDPKDEMPPRFVGP